MRTAEQIARYAATRKAYYDANRDKLLERARARRKVPELKAKEQQRQKAYRDANKDKLNAMERLRYWLTHPPKPKAPAPEPTPVEVAPEPQPQYKTCWQSVRKWTRDEWRGEFGSRTTFRPRRGDAGVAPAESCRGEVA